MFFLGQKLREKSKLYISTLYKNSLKFVRNKEVISLKFTNLNQEINNWTVEKAVTLTVGDAWLDYHRLPRLDIRNQKTSFIESSLFRFVFVKFISRRICRAFCRYYMGEDVRYFLSVIYDKQLCLRRKGHMRKSYNLNLSV